MRQSDVRLNGRTVECRITAEQPQRRLFASLGLVTRWEPPEGPGARVNTHGYAGYRVLPFYDSLLAKLIASRADREQAIDRLREALQGFSLDGVDTSVGFLAHLLAHNLTAASGGQYTGGGGALGTLQPPEPASP